jgi:hypothetical protein
MNNTTLTFINKSNDYTILGFVNFYVHDILGSLIYIFGLIFNLISFTYFQLSRSFNKTSLRHYFSVVAITDSIRLQEWLFAFLLNHNFILLDRRLCGIIYFITMTSGHISIWLLVLLSIERFIILQFPFKG